MDIWRLLFSFRGRIGRAMYWLGALFFLIVWLVLWIGFFTISNKFIGSVVGIIGVVVGFILTFAILIKRLHDRDKSAWYLLLYFVAPGLLQGIAEQAGRTQPMAIVVYLAGAAIAIWAAVELGFLRGTVGPNRYGPDPLGDAEPPTNIS